MSQRVAQQEPAKVVGWLRLTNFFNPPAEIAHVVSGLCRSGRDPVVVHRLEEP
jgi:hypothetical protein